MSWRNQPVLILELRGGLSENDQMLSCQYVLPILPWGENERLAVAHIGEEMTRRILDLQKSYEGG